MTMMSHLKIMKIHPKARTPVKSSLMATGHDLFSVEDVFLEVGEWKAVKTGLVFDMRNLGSYIDVQIRPRSGMAFNHGITVLNSPGTIDRDYLGEIMVILINHGDYAYQVKSGDKIAQMVFGMVAADPHMFVTTSIDGTATERGTGGIGSTGR